MNVSSSILAENMFCIVPGVTPHQNIQNLLKLLRISKYREDSYKHDFNGVITVSEKKSNGFFGNQAIYFQEAFKGNGFRVLGHDESYLRKFDISANNINEKRYEELYVTGSGMILYIQGNSKYFASHLDAKHLKEYAKGELSTVGNLEEIISPEYKKAIEAGAIFKNLREGMTWEVGCGYKVHAYLDRVSRSNNLVITSNLETPDGQKFQLSEILLSAFKIDKVKSTILHGIKNIIKQFEFLTKGGETPEVALQIATVEDSAEAARRVDFIRRNPDIGISIKYAICPDWYQGVGPINQISLSGYNETAIAHAIGFIGEPIEPQKYSLEYKTREGENNPWTIEISFTSPEGGGGRYWFYLDGSTADAHNGNLETLSACGNFEQYRSLLWIFLNPLREELSKK